MTEMKAPHILTPIKVIRLGNNHFPRLIQTTQNRGHKKIIKFIRSSLIRPCKF